MQRYFAQNVNEDNIVLLESDVFHLTKVMRAKSHDELIAIFNEEVYLGEIISFKPFVIKNKGKVEERNRELDKKVTLFFALAKGDKIDFVIQKATELGVSKVVLIKTEHCIVKMNDEDLNNKINNRYLRIAKEASEQSERRKIIDILGVYDIKRIPQELLCDINYVAYEKEAFSKSSLAIIKEKKSISLLIGPEGGLTKDEVDALINQGFETVSLGKRILRTETAAVVGLAMINMVIEQ